MENLNTPTVSQSGPNIVPGYPDPVIKYEKLDDSLRISNIDERSRLPLKNIFEFKDQYNHSAVAVIKKESGSDIDPFKDNIKYIDVNSGRNAYGTRIDETKGQVLIPSDGFFTFTVRIYNPNKAIISYTNIPGISINVNSTEGIDGVATDIVSITGNKTNEGSLYWSHKIEFWDPNKPNHKLTLDLFG